MNTLDDILAKKNVPAIKRKEFLIDSMISCPYIEHHHKLEALDLQTIFGNHNPVTVEIGCGRGELITKLSELNRERNYLGLELSGKRIATILKKIDRNVNQNIRIMRAYVNTDFLSNFEEKSIKQMIILHPDPWPKRRHHKNRLINSQFITKLSEILTPDGELLISTDNKNYAAAIINCFAASEDYSAVYENGYSRESFWDNISTYFEDKMGKQGFHPYYMKYLLK